MVKNWRYLIICVNNKVFSLALSSQNLESKVSVNHFPILLPGVGGQKLIKNNIIILLLPLFCWIHLIFFQKKP